MHGIVYIFYIYHHLAPKKQPNVGKIYRSSHGSYWDMDGVPPSTLNDGALETSGCKGSPDRSGDMSVTMPLRLVTDRWPKCPLLPLGFDLYT